MGRGQARTKLSAIGYPLSACVALLGGWQLHADPEWVLARSAHFEVYSQSGEASARSLATWLEQLRALVGLHTGLMPDGRGPLRVIEFRSTAEYEPYRARPGADAYYVGSESRDYIVMAGGARLSVAAHEYAHAALRSSGTELPLWMREGLAEVLSTARITARGASIGGDVADRAERLRRDRWIALPELLSMTVEEGLEDRIQTFYAESWALADMVLLSPEYRADFRRFAEALARGANSREAFERVYGKVVNSVEADLRRLNTRHGRTPVRLDGAAPAAVAVECSAVAPLRARLLIAEVVLLTGDPAQAESLYRELERGAPDDPDIALGLGTLALRRGDSALARDEWKKAIAFGVADAALCFRYASLANLTGAPADDIRPALLRAIELQPDFDDARFSLALLESNAGHHEAAVAQLRAMHRVAPARAYGYWSALADSLTQLGDRAGAKAAAGKASEFAASDEERRHAAALAHIAATDFAVRMTSNGMVATRIAHGTENFNPFIEPGDAMERIEGTLREVDCGDPVLRIRVETATGVVTLAIPAIDRILIRNGAGEFTCGPQSGARVAIDYARARAAPAGVAGDVRGLEFR